MLKISHLIEIPFIGNKMQTYMYGDWAEYRYMLFLLMILFIVFIIFFKFYKKNNLELDAFQIRYTNFIFLYFALSLLFISFRTIEYRLLISGFVFLFHCFIKFFILERFFK